MDTLAYKVAKGYGFSMKSASNTFDSYYRDAKRSAVVSFLTDVAKFTSSKRSLKFQVKSSPMPVLSFKGKDSEGFTVEGVLKIFFRSVDSIDVILDASNLGTSSDIAESKTFKTKIGPEPVARMLFDAIR